MGELSGIILYYFGPQLTPISRLIAPHLVGHTSKLFLGCLYFCFQCTIKINHSFAMQKLRFHLELLGEFQDKIIRNSPQRSIWFPVLDFCIRSRNKLISLPKAKKTLCAKRFWKIHTTCILRQSNKIVTGSIRILYLSDILFLDRRFIVFKRSSSAKYLFNTLPKITPLSLVQRTKKITTTSSLLCYFPFRTRRLLLPSQSNRTFKPLLIHEGRK